MPMGKKKLPLKTNILHIITRLDMGGSAQNTIATCIGLSGKEYRIVLACGLSAESNMTDDERRTVSKSLVDAKKRGSWLTTIPTLIRKIDPRYDIAALLSLVRLIGRLKPDIVHTHTSKAGVLGRLAAWIMRVPVIVHTPHGHVFYGHFSKQLSNIFLHVEKAFDKITDRTIALTDGERNDYLRQSVSRPEKLVKIHSGVNVKKFIDAGVDAVSKRKHLGIKPTETVVGTVGWLLPIKGPTYLLKAMQQVWLDYPDVKLIYVGKGELEISLKTMADTMGVQEKILFMGWRDDVHEIMQTFDIFVLPSLNEGMGRVIVEAMAAGKPVVASNTGGIPDLVVEGETGFLVNPGDIAGIAKAIERLLENRNLKEAMGQAGQQRCHMFSEELMIEKIDKLYKELLME